MQMLFVDEWSGGHPANRKSHPLHSNLRLATEKGCPALGWMPVTDVLGYAQTANHPDFLCWHQ